MFTWRLKNFITATSALETFLPLQTVILRNCQPVPGTIKKYTLRFLEKFYSLHGKEFEFTIKKGGLLRETQPAVWNANFNRKSESSAKHKSLQKTWVKLYRTQHEFP